MRVLIVDDEVLARAVLRELLAAHPEVEIVGEAGNGFEAVKLADELAPDLLFLDIQMPKLSGFEVMELVGEKVAVIFVTAYDEFALKAFDVHAVDYLLKPVEPARLGEAIERAAARLAIEQARPSAAAVAAAARPPGRPLERVLIREEGRVHVLPLGRSTSWRPRTTTCPSRSPASACRNSRLWASSKRSSTAAASCACTAPTC